MPAWQAYLSEQYLTSFQTFAHFLRHVKGLPQVAQILLGKSDLLGAFFLGWPAPPLLAATAVAAVPIGQGLVGAGATSPGGVHEMRTLERAAVRVLWPKMGCSMLQSITKVCGRERERRAACEYRVILICEGMFALQQNCQTLGPTPFSIQPLS